MKIVEVKFVPWDKEYYFSCNDIELKTKDRVLVKSDSSMEIAEVFSVFDSEEEIAVKKKINVEELSPVLKKASKSDLEKVPGRSEIDSAIITCNEYKIKHKLEMKFVDVHFSYDGSRITFAFIADGRVDFRELVKDLTRHFGKTIRLQQIGIRDEAKIMGDFGHCGRCLCCRGHLKELRSIVSEMAEIQQCSHRGSDRISGICGRLMCCLAYEFENYEELSAKMPPIGTKVNVDGKRGEVVGHHTLKQSVDVEFSDKKGGSMIVEIDLNRNKKKK